MKFDSAITDLFCFDKGYKDNENYAITIYSSFLIHIVFFRLGGDESLNNFKCEV